MPILTAEEIYGFVDLFLVERFDDPSPTPKCHLEWWDLVGSDHRRVAIAAPRGHSKSTSISLSFVLACMLFRKKQFAIIISYTERQAKRLIANIKLQLKNNKTLHKAFGVPKFIKDSETDLIVEMDDGYQFKILAYGSEQGFRGETWDVKRPDLIVGDDLEDDEMVMSEERRLKFKEEFFSKLMPIGSRSAHFRLVGTILHADSLLENLMPQTGGGEGKFPAGNPEFTKTDGLRWWNEDPKAKWKSMKYAAHTKDMTQLLWPERFSQAWLEDERDNFRQAGIIEKYYQEYLNVPIDDEGGFFRKQDMLPIPKAGMEEYMEYYAAADLAISSKDHRAFTVILVGGLTQEGILRIVDVRRFRGDSRDIIDELFSVQKRYSPVLMGIERENIAKSLGPILYEEMGTKGNPFINIQELPPILDKPTRARSIQARMRAGKVQFNTEADWWNTFEQELLQFTNKGPRGTYADQVDAFAWLGIMLDKMTSAATFEELREEWFNDAMGQEDEHEGRDFYTGY